MAKAKKKWEPSKPLENKRFEQFVKKYLANGMIGAKAAIDCKYSEKSAKQQAYKILQDAKVQARINWLQRDRLKRLDIDADSFLLELFDAWNGDFSDLFNDEGGFKSPDELPLIWRKMINGVENVELFEGRGEDREQVGNLKKIRWIDKTKILDMIGKHVGVQAFKETIEHNGKISHTHEVKGLQSFAERVKAGVGG